MGLYTTLKHEEKTRKPVNIQLIIPVGTAAALDVAQKIHDIPLVFSMVFAPESSLAAYSNVVGASLNIPFELQLEMIQNTLPNVNTVGIMYAPSKNADMVNSYIEQSSASPLAIKLFPVHSQKDLPAALKTVMKETDVLLGIVDSTVYTSQTTQFIIRSTIKQQFPFIGLSSSYVKAGALCALFF